MSHRLEAFDPMLEAKAADCVATPP